MQRQLHALAHLNFAEAWRLNAGLLLCYPYLSVLFLSQLSPSFRNTRLSKKCHSRAAFLSFLIFFILWGILRNFIGVSPTYS